MQSSHAAKTTATRILELLERDGKLVQHGEYKVCDTVVATSNFFLASFIISIQKSTIELWK